MPLCIGLSTKMHDKKNETIFAILRHSFAVVWPVKGSKPLLKYLLLSLLLIFFWRGNCLLSRQKHSLQLNRKKLQNMTKKLAVKIDLLMKTA